MYARDMSLSFSRRHTAGLALILAGIVGGVTLVASAGCKDAAKVGEEMATHSATLMAARATEDVAEVKRGLPLGATQLAALYASGSDPAKDLPAVRKGLRRVRAEVPDLTRAVSTFFALADAQGIAVRNDLEQDVMAGQDVLKLFPDLAKAKDGGVVTATGLFGGARAPGEADRDWVAAAPIKDAQGTFVGYLLTGWTLRRFAFHLQEALKHDLIEEQAKTKDPGKLPIVYVSVFDKSGLYAAPLTPAVNEKALTDLDLVSKTAGGAAHGTLTITDRDFGYAASRVPELEPDAGIVVLWSEI
jgi:hypothetical protein